MTACLTGRCCQTDTFVFSSEQLSGWQPTSQGVVSLRFKPGSYLPRPCEHYISAVSLNRWRELSLFYRSVMHVLWPLVIILHTAIPCFSSPTVTLDSAVITGLNYGLIDKFLGIPYALSPWVVIHTGSVADLKFWQYWWPSFSKTYRTSTISRELRRDSVWSFLYSTNDLSAYCSRRIIVDD